MTNQNNERRVNPAYAFRQLAKALSSSGERSATRVKQWQRVIEGMLDGTLSIGSRTPVEEVPPWVTLEVVHGGFATGNFAAGGILLPHEIERLRTVDRPEKDPDRTALNLHYLSDAGRAELSSMLDKGCFRAHVPEEGALLVVAWLIGRGETARAEDLIETILPFFRRLRFYPVPHPRPLRSGTAVYLQPAGESVVGLREKRPKKSVERMKESIQIWAPLYDHAVSLFLETVEGEEPSLRTNAAGELTRRTDGHPIVDGGWPCKRYENDWNGRARQILKDYEKARTRHRLCGKPEKPKENFARLRGYMKKCIDDPGTLTGRDVGMIRKILASCVTRHGAPGSQRLVTTRAQQARNAARPMHSAIAGVLADRLQRYRQDEGVSDIHRVLVPLTEEEAVHLGASTGVSIPNHLATHVKRCLEAPLEVLVEQDVIPSSEVIARVLPLLTARIRSSAIDDPELKRVYESVYTAFRRRRSLLLLDLESQVNLGELPWISAIAPWVGSGLESRQAARETFVLAASLAIEAFPYTILPNKLIKELRALAEGADQHVPLVDELAADIFMGAFSAKFLRSAQIAARMLRDSLYERYYGLPCERVLGLEDLDTKRFGTPSSPGFAKLCEELAGVGKQPFGSGSVARNGAIIEQAQVLTTHNLASLFDSLKLTDSMQSKPADLSRRCFEWVCRRQQMKIIDWHAQLQMVKNTAYAWRQMIFFLSISDPSEIASFLSWSADRLTQQREEFRIRFEPVMAGLDAVAKGERFEVDGTHAESGGRRFLGWSVGRHWLLPAGATSP